MLKHAKIQTFLQIDTHFEMFLIVHKKKKKESSHYSFTNLSIKPHQDELNTIQN
jgi:hypothetical protein